jgi:hypothetical protein
VFLGDDNFLVVGLDRYTDFVADVDGKVEILLPSIALPICLVFPSKYIFGMLLFQEYTMLSTANKYSYTRKSDRTIQQSPRC